MIIPIKCFQCGKPVGHLWEKYVELVKDFRTKNNDENAIPTPEAKALDAMGMTRDCCRIAFMCNPDLALLISSNVSNVK